LVQHQFNSGEFFEVIGDGDVEHQVASASEPDKDYGIGLVLYISPKRMELGLTEDRRHVTMDASKEEISKGLPFTAKPDPEDEFRG